MSYRSTILTPALLWLCAAALVGCGDDDHEVDADALGIGASCTRDEDCHDGAPDAGETQDCLTQFKGGYCGLTDCMATSDCPDGSACVRHDDGNNYCFRTCLDKAECNAHRGPDEESNCSSNIDFVGGSKSELGKACVPPTGS